MIMILNIDTATNIRYTDETGTYYFHEGDKVICHVGERVYNGTISWIGAYQENADSELQQVIYIDTWNGRTSMSREMVMLKDITDICKKPFYDERPFGNEKDFMNTYTKNGYSKEQAEALCNRLNDMTNFYCIPYIKATTYAIEAVRQINISDKNDVRDIIMDGAKQCIEEAQREYFDLIEIYAKAIEQRNRDVSCLTDTIDIASKCWNDLRNLKVGDRENKN